MRRKPRHRRWSKCKRGSEQVCPRTMGGDARMPGDGLCERNVLYGVDCSSETEM